MEIVKAKPVRWPIFSRKLKAACDRHPNCPPLNHGRQVWLRDRLSELNVDVEIESVRKWLSGEMRPRFEKGQALARVLDVELADLYGNAFVKKSTDKVDNLEGPPPSNALPIPVRANLTIQVVGLPFDLSKAEAQKIANIILAHAVGE